MSVFYLIAFPGSLRLMVQEIYEGEVAPSIAWKSGRQGPKQVSQESSNRAEETMKDLV